MMYSLDEVGLVPAEISEIKHRADVNPFVESPFGGEKLPVFVAPMTCILGANNICDFSKSKFEPILPVVSSTLELRRQLPNGSDWLGWTAMTLDEFKQMFTNPYIHIEGSRYILIDVANGHMKELFLSVIAAKKLHPDNLKVMIGNIANPSTYLDCCRAGVDYVRVGIGGGTGCTTSVQTGIHTSLPFILEGIKKAKYKWDHLIPDECGDARKVSLEEYVAYHHGIITKVVADGGVTTIARAIKCLALGADYVMMGKAFSACEEGGFVTNYRHSYDKKGVTALKEHLYYGQSSEQGQMDRFGKIKSNPEGSETWIPVTTNLKEFTTKFEAALRSAMSYCNAKTLKNFIGKVKYEYMSQAEFGAFIK